jgi:hypothetical protein
MNRLVLVFWAVVAASPVYAASPSLRFEVGVGGGYDDNLSQASSANQREGAGFGTSWLTAGASMPASRNIRILVSGNYSGTYYADVDELTVNALAVRSSGRVSLGDSTSMTVGAGAGHPGMETRIGTPRCTTPRVAVTAAYRYTSQAAEVSTFSSRRNRLAVGGEFTPTAGSWFGLGYAMEVGPSVFYQSTLTPIPSSGRGRRPSTTFGAGQVAFNADATIHTASTWWEQEAGDSLVVPVEYAHALIVADPGDARDNLVWASVAYRY